jgi:hypothetical protein
MSHTIDFLNEIKKFPQSESIKIIVKMHAHLSKCMASRVLYRILYLPEHIDGFKFPRDLNYILTFNTLDELIEFVKLDEKTYDDHKNRIDFIHSPTNDEEISSKHDSEYKEFLCSLDNERSADFSIWEKITIIYLDSKIIIDRDEMTTKLGHKIIDQDTYLILAQFCGMIPYTKPKCDCDCYCGNKEY